MLWLCCTSIDFNLHGQWFRISVKQWSIWKGGTCVKYVPLLSGWHAQISSYCLFNAVLNSVTLYLWKINFGGDNYIIFWREIPEGGTTGKWVLFKYFSSMLYVCLFCFTWLQICELYVLDYYLCYLGLGLGLGLVHTRKSWERTSSKVARARTPIAPMQLILPNAFRMKYASIYILY